MENNLIADFILDKLDEFSESTDALTEEQLDDMSNVVTSHEELDSVLPSLVDRNESLKQFVADANEKQKFWSDKKKIGQSKQSKLVSFVGHLLDKFSVTKYTSASVNISTRITRTLNVNEDALLAEYQGLLAMLQSQLPSYIKISASIDKRMLTKMIEDDPEILSDNIDNIHWESKESITIK